MQLPSHGFLILDKPLGISSAKAVAEVKRALKCQKIGHGGTLDPLASGVLPLAIGEATKAFSYVVSAVKKYHFTITFGEERSTGDAEGEVTAKTDVIPRIEDIVRVLPEFIGTIMQAPPAYSAISVGGKRAYEMARAGEAVELAARPVEILGLKLLATSHLPLVTLSVTCGKGTYIRSLAQDIARKINSLGYVSMLRRVSVGRFHEENAISLDSLKENVYKPAFTKFWVPIELALDDIPAIDVGADEASLLRHGQTIPVHWSDGECMALHGGHIVALAEIKSGRLRTMRVFNL